MTGPLMSRGEVAALLGISPEAVRGTLRRYGIHEVRGYPRDAVQRLAAPGGRSGRGRRTDLASIGCTSNRHDRTSCDRAFSNGEISEDEWCPTCLHQAKPAASR